MTQLTDGELVERALRLLPPNNYEAARTLHVAEGTIRRWRGGTVSPLRGNTRRALEAFLERTEPGRRGRRASPAGPAGTGEDEVRRQLEEIEALETDERMKAWKIAEVAAAYRAKALSDLAAALRQEGRVAQLRIGAAQGQTGGSEESVEEARIRELIEEAVRTRRVPRELIEGKELPAADEEVVPRAEDPDAAD